MKRAIWEIGLGDNDCDVFSPRKGQNPAQANMNLVAMCYRDNKKAHAQMIVDDHNSHDKLLKALEKIKGLQAEYNRRGIGFDYVIHDIAEKAIKDAK